MSLFKFLVHHEGKQYGFLDLVDSDRYCYIDMVEDCLNAAKVTKEKSQNSSFSIKGSMFSRPGRLYQIDDDYDVMRMFNMNDGAEVVELHLTLTNIEQDDESILPLPQPQTDPPRPSPQPSPTQPSPQFCTSPPQTDPPHPSPQPSPTQPSPQFGTSPPQTDPPHPSPQPSPTQPSPQFCGGGDDDESFQWTDDEEGDDWEASGDEISDEVSVQLTNSSGSEDSGGQLSDFESNNDSGTSSGEEDEEQHSGMAKVGKGLGKHKFYKKKGEKIEFYVGQEFNNVDEFRVVLKDYVCQEGVIISRDKNERTRVTCSCVVEGCPWRIHASPHFGTTTFVVKSYNPEHNCERLKMIPECDASWISKRLSKTVQATPDIKIKGMREILNNKYGLGAEKWTLYRARRRVREELEGDYSKSYALVPVYTEVVRKTNPGSVVKLQLERPTMHHQPTFKRFFFCLNAMKQGFFAGCRPFISMDGTFLKGPYGGILLVAVALDGNAGLSLSLLLDN